MCVSTRGEMPGVLRDRHHGFSCRTSGELWIEGRHADHGGASPTPRGATNGGTPPRASSRGLAQAPMS
jgi:hypothetical protein